jgi:2-C-methyl-D-erythritol 4-phosphate cytidylyltransferase
MIYGAILAGGSGTRMKSIDIPKQFVEVEGKPIILYTMEHMLAVQRFDYIYIAVHADYEDYMKKLAATMEQPEKFRILLGGKERMDTIHNVTDAIEADHGIGEDDVIVIHDAARPFVTKQILSDSIDAAAKYGACVAAVPASDTMLHSVSGDVVDDIPVRSEIFHGQAPDSFNLKHFLDMQAALTPEQREAITGTSQICTMNNQPIHMIKGDTINFKITTDSDLAVVRSILSGNQ